MSQNSVDFSDNPNGPELMDDYLAKEQENRLTINSGIQRPSYAKVGTPWINNSTNPWKLYIYDGTSDVLIGDVDATNHEFISSNFEDVVNLTTDQNVAGVKTFSASPVVPTPSSSDNSSKVANTAFVTGVKSGLQTQINSKAADNAVVKLTGAQTIADIKTFTSSPVVPTPATSDNSTKAATTAYVNNWINANTASAHVVIETYKSGSSWYRIYDDGWIEQGGWKSGFSSANTFEDVTLHKEFADTYYNIQISGGGNNTTIHNYKTGNPSTNTTTAFKLLASNTGAACWWYACGMGA